MDNTLRPWVTCYAGSSYPEHPTAFRWQDKSYSVLEVIHRWRTPLGLGFFVRCLPNDALFELFYNTQKVTWQIHPRGYNNMTEKPQHKVNHQGD